MNNDLERFMAKIAEELGPQDPPKLPQHFYNIDGELIEVSNTNDHFCAKWIDHNLTLMLSQPEEKIVGYYIEDFYGLLKKCGVKRETCEKIKELIKADVEEFSRE